MGWAYPHAGEAMNNDIDLTPNYDKRCIVCGRKPTVTVRFEDGSIDHSELCGACYWGESDCIDPENW